MSLTDLIRTDPEVRAQLAAALTRPQFRSASCLIPARSTRRNVTGTAFDYLLRFELHRRHPGLAVHAGWWVAELGGRGAPQPRKTQAFLKSTRALVHAYVQGQADVREVALACTVLAKLDLMYRSGWVDPDLLTPLPEMAEELLALLDVVPFENFRAARHLVLNPTFGKAGAAVGGADADLVVDDLLIDVKTTATAKVSLDELRQLAGYVLLWRTGGLHVLASPGHQVVVPATIRRVGLYYARYGQLVTVDLNDFLPAPGGDLLTAWWRARFGLLLGTEHP